MSYDNPTSTTLFAIDPSTPSGAKLSYVQVTAREANLKEDWFRDSIAHDPELVLSACRRAKLTDEQWYLWDTEVAVVDDGGRSIGYIDVLLVSETGRIGVVETKLSYNPERRRSVIAQLLDYALHLSSDALFEQVSPLPSIDGYPVVQQDKVFDRIRERDYLLIVAGDTLDPRAVRLGQTMLGDHILQKWDLAMVDMLLYRAADSTARVPWLLVPTLRGTLLNETRHILEVRVEGLPAGTYTSVTPVEPEVKTPSSRERWDQSRFEEALAASKLPAPFVNLGKRLLALGLEHPDLQARFGSSKDGSLVLARNGTGIIEFFLAGWLRWRPYSMDKALPAELASRYLNGLGSLFPRSAKDAYPCPTVDEVLPKADEVIALIETAVADAALMQ